MSFFFFVCFIFASKVFALTEQEFIQKVLSQDTRFEKDQIYVDIKKIELDTSRKSYVGWNTHLTTILTNSRYDIDKDTNSKKAYEKKRIKNQQSIRLETEKRFLHNPSSLKFSATYSTPNTDIVRYKQDDYFGNHNISTFDNNYRMSYKYPLLKHDDSAVSLKTYQRNIFDLQREKLDFYDAQEGFLVDRLEQYLLWNLYEKNTEVYKKYLQMLHSIEVNKPTDKAKLKTAILLANKDILENDSQLKSQKEALAVALNDAGLLMEKSEIEPMKSPNIITTDLVQYLRKNSRILLKYAIDQKLKTIDLKYYKNQNLIKLDFGISAEKNANKGNTLTTKYDNNNINYVASLSLVMPIGGSVKNQSQIVISELNLRKLVIDFNNKLKDIKVDARALGVRLRLNQKILHDYKLAVDSVMVDANLAYDNYSNHTIQLKNLLDAYKEKRDVELEYVDFVIKHHQNILEYNDKLDRVLGNNLES